MENTSWLKQSDKALFEDILWSRPQNKRQSGKLLIVGGHKLDYFAPLTAHQISTREGVGSAKVVMPNKVAKDILASEQVESVESTPSGGISPNAMNTLTSMAADSDALLFPGSLGRDSGTIMLLERLVEDIDLTITMTGDALDASSKFHETTLNRANLNLVGSLAQLRTLQTTLHQTSAITHDIGVVKLVDILATLSESFDFSITTFCSEQLVSAFSGMVVSTKLNLKEDPEGFRWRVEFASISSVLTMQFPDQRLEALATSAWLMRG